MMEISVQSSQSLLDIALIASGSADAVYDMALENGMAITDETVSEQVLSYSGAPINKKVVEYYAVNGIKPATGY
jgi:hypothetical protein